ncbi:OSTF1 factor, partial [Amia calva]|nr:OSTF1 factor [Amia calva]
MCALDPFPSCLFQATAPDLLPFISSLLNSSLLSGCFPSAFKQAAVIPLLKRPTLDATSPQNYRPVSLLPFLSKTLERAVSDSNWWKGTCRGRTGLIPSNYVAEQAESIDNPMHEAAKRGNVSWLRECLENKVGINGLDKAGNTALYWACHGGHKDVVEMLLGHSNVELNQQNKLGDTALHAAAWKGYSDIVEMLLNKNARTDILNNEKKLALEMATNAQCASLLKRKQGTSKCDQIGLLIDLCLIGVYSFDPVKE